MEEVQTVEITKRPGQSLGFYIREGNGRDRTDGVFISRLAAGGVADLNGLLRVGDEILSVNTVGVSGRRLEDVVISMSVARRLVLAVRPAPAVCSDTNSSSSLSALANTDEDDGSSPNPVVIVRSGARSTNAQDGMPPMTSSANHHGRYGNGGVMRPGDECMMRGVQQPRGVHYPSDESADSGLSSDNSGFYCRPAVGPWNGNPVMDRRMQQPISRRPEQLPNSAFYPQSTLPGANASSVLRASHPGYFSDSEAEYSPTGQRFATFSRSNAVGGQRLAANNRVSYGAGPPPEWIDRMMLNDGVRPPKYMNSNDLYCTMGRRPRQLNGTGSVQNNAMGLTVAPDEIPSNNDRHMSARDR